MLFYSKGLSHPIIVKSMQQNMFKSVQLHHVQSSSKEEIKKKNKTTTTIFDSSRKFILCPF